MRESSNSLLTLSAAALLLNGLAQPASANPPDQKVRVDYRYSSYEEGDIAASKLAEGSAQRYSIEVHQFKIKAPTTEDTELTISGVQETMSGASPWYVLPDENGRPVQVMSGATIDESRSEISADFRSYNSRSESTLSASYSSENDYTSIGFGYSGNWRFNENLTTLSYGINTAQDYIDATDAKIYPGRPEEESKSRMGAFLGLSRVLSKTTLAGVTLGYSSLNGYLSDPYKLAWVENAPVQDSRPDTQNQASAALMLREFFPSANAALHVDYRYYQNNWKMSSHTLDLAWYQTIWDGWQLIPSLRFYSQTKTIFYRPYYTSTRGDGYYSSDYRLSAFDSTSARIKLSKQWDSFSVNMSYESYTSAGNNPGLLDFSLLGLGVGAIF